MKQFKVVSALMGSGKTREFINWAKNEGRVLLAVPKINLAESVAKRMRTEGINPTVIHSNQAEESRTADRLSDALAGGEGHIVTTQASLLNVSPRLLKGWKVVVDEVPSLNKYQRTKIVPFSAFHALFDEFVTVDEETEVCAYQGFITQDEMREQFFKYQCTEETSCEVMFRGMSSSTARVSVEKRPKGYIIKSVDYHDWRPIVESAEEFTVMGAAVHSWLFYWHLVLHGFEPVMNEELQPSFKGYKIPPVLVPMVDTPNLSKTIMTTLPDGTVSENNRFTRECFGQDVADNAVSVMDGGKKTIVQTHKWMMPAFKGKKNLELIDFDSRGTNDHNDVAQSINIIHGNPEPIEKQMILEMFELMGFEEDHIEHCLGCIRHERFLDPLAQAILRTNQREVDNQTQQVKVAVPTLNDATALEEMLEGAVIDKSQMLKPYKKAPSKEAMAKDELIKAVCERWSEMQESRKPNGKKWTQKDIMAEFGIKSPKTLRGYLKAA